MTTTRCLCITGPTATGKTALALELAKRVPIEIVSMDSAMVYRGMDVGTAKPDEGERAAVAHHLIDIVDPGERYSAGRFARDAHAAIRDIESRGRLPVLVGGTLLYLRALRDGLAQLPRADAALRAQIERDAAALGWPALHARLAAVDPAAAQRIAPTDPQRIQRALEVYELSGVPLTELQANAVPGERPRVVTVALIPEDRAALGAAIERRFDRMVQCGFVAEVEALRARGDLSPDLPAMRAVGYRQIWGYLEGAYEWAEARRRAVTATRQFAKRQLTWLRGERDAQSWPAFSEFLTERLCETVVAHFKQSA